METLLLLLLLPLQALLLLRVHAISRASSCVYQPHTGLICISDAYQLCMRVRISLIRAYDHLLDI